MTDSEAATAGRPRSHQGQNHSTTRDLARHAELVADRESFRTASDRDFFLRVFDTDYEVYRARLEAAGFTGRTRVLDAGCGYGQWTIALADLNGAAYGIDVDPFRVRIASDLADRTASSARFAAGSLTQLPFARGSFDAVYCYGVVFLTDWRGSVRELVRVLAPGGRLQICANSLGWYLHNLIEGHKSSIDFSPRRMAAQAFATSARYYASGRHDAGQIIIPPRVLARALSVEGCRDVEWSGEGTFADSAVPAAAPFFAGRKYGMTGVYEIRCTR